MKTEWCRPGRPCLILFEISFESKAPVCAIGVCRSKFLLHGLAFIQRRRATFGAVSVKYFFKLEPVRFVWTARHYHADSRCKIGERSSLLIFQWSRSRRTQYIGPPIIISHLPCETGWPSLPGVKSLARSSHIGEEVHPWSGSSQIWELTQFYVWVPQCGDANRTGYSKWHFAHHNTSFHHKCRLCNAPTPLRQQRAMVHRDRYESSVRLACDPVSWSCFNKRLMCFLARPFPR